MKNQHFVAEIQALRAIAVVLVLLYHAGIELLPGGFIGVDVFFVISGFLITSLLLRELRATGHIRFWQFYARRIRRLLPAASLVLLVTTIGAWYTYSPLDFKQYSSSAIATAVYLSNFWFAHLATDYLAADAHSNPLLHTWSLSVEEQFYLVWPVLVFLLYRFGRNSQSVKPMLAGLTAVCVVSFAASSYLTNYHQPFAFFGSPTRAWEFGVGGLVAVCNWSGVLANSRRIPILSLLGLGLILVPAMIYDQQTPFPGLAAVWPVLGTALVIVTSLVSYNLKFTGWMRQSAVQFVGNISYSLYLWHWPVLIYLNAQEGFSRATSLSVYFVASFVLASLTYYAVENPVRFNSLMARRVLASFLFGAALTVSTTSSAYLMRQMSVSELSSERQLRYQRASEDIPETYNDGCHLPFFETDLQDCVYGDIDAGKTLVLFGDSHAAQWFPALERIALDEGYALVSLTKSGCPSMSFEPFSKALKRPYTECTEWRNRAFERIESLKPELVILANSSHHSLEDFEHDLNTAYSRWAGATAETYAKIHQTGVRVALLRDTPMLAFNAPSCLSRAAWKNLDPKLNCLFSAASKTHETIFTIEKEQLQFSTDFVIDMTEYICAGGTDCPTERDNMILYLDSDHLTTEFSRYLSRPLFAEIRKAAE